MAFISCALLRKGKVQTTQFFSLCRRHIWTRVSPIFFGDIVQNSPGRNGKKIFSLKFRRNCWADRDETAERNCRAGYKGVPKMAPIDKSPFKEWVSEQGVGRECEYSNGRAWVSECEYMTSVLLGNMYLFFIGFYNYFLNVRLCF